LSTVSRKSQSKKREGRFEVAASWRTSRLEEWKGSAGKRVFMGIGRKTAVGTARVKLFLTEMGVNRTRIVDLPR
jgi:hypothetical protein